jgi:fructose-specific phosphotransferase system IIC component
MTMLKRVGILFAAWIIIACAIQLAGPLNIAAVSSFVSTVEAKVGRPLTPVSVAGVGRRTARRCAAGVYDC